MTTLDQILAVAPLWLLIGGFVLVFSLDLIWSVDIYYSNKDFALFVAFCALVFVLWPIWLLYVAHVAVMVLRNGGEK